MPFERSVPESFIRSFLGSDSQSTDEMADNGSLPNCSATTTQPQANLYSRSCPICCLNAFFYKRFFTSNLLKTVIQTRAPLEQSSKPAQRFQKMVDVKSARPSSRQPSPTPMIRSIACLLVLGGLSLLLPMPAAAKTVGELTLECSQATALRSNRNPVGIDPYQIATCFGYLEAHLDLRPQHFCVPQSLDMTALASQLLVKLEPYATNASASEALMGVLIATYPCPE